MPKKADPKISGNITIVQFEEALSQYASSATKEAAILFRIETEMGRIKEKYNSELNHLQTKKNDSVEILAAYCKEQKDTLFNRRRSLLTVHGTVGFRLCTPKLKTLKGHSWTSVMQKVKEKIPAYIRTTEELAKDMLIADRMNEKIAPLLNEIGLQVVQDEAFYVELNKIVM
ncbi:MAG TPA: host-nuclease inhibitor Gam family protein [Flavipsychrobacter sp.]|nr:host-nuclease inhibitor Gam family protein [Flavipsychrobacter sp.]